MGLVAPWHVGSSRAREVQLTGHLYGARIIPSMLTKIYIPRGFPGGTVVKKPPVNAGDMGSSPGPGRSHMPRSN